LFLFLQILAVTVSDS